MGCPCFVGWLAGVRLDLVVTGGWDPKTWIVSNNVYIYNFVSTTWRRGVDLLGVQRSFFGYACDDNRIVFDAYGHDDEKNALKSMIAYDITKYVWILLPDMAQAMTSAKRYSIVASSMSLVDIVWNYKMDLKEMLKPLIFPHGSGIK